MPELMGEREGSVVLPDSSVPCGSKRRPQSGIAGRNNTEEDVMTPSHGQPEGPGESARKTLAIRLEAEQHAQLSMIAQLEALTVTDAIRQAIEQWIGAKRNNPLMQERVQAVLDDIERDAATKRGALAALLEGHEDKAPATRRKSPIGYAPATQRTSRSKGDKPAAS